jgi:hypothetical protein
MIVVFVFASSSQSFFVAFSLAFRYFALFFSRFHILGVLTILDSLTMISPQHIAHVITPAVLFIVPQPYLCLPPLHCGHYRSSFASHVVHAAWHAVYYALLCTYHRSTSVAEGTVWKPITSGRPAKRLRFFNFPCRSYKRRGL